MNLSSARLLRRALAADAITSAAAGVLMLGGGGVLSPALGLPEALLRFAGLSLIPFALGVAWIAARAEIPRAPVAAVAILNGAWAAGSIVLLASGVLAPTGPGYAFVGAQALAVAVFAALQAMTAARRREAAA